MRLARYRGRHLRRRRRGRGAAVGAAATVVVAAAPASAGEYVVRRGETLSEIARRVGTSVSRLVKMNNLSNPNFIVAGTQLRTPGRTGGGGGGGGTYLVRSGDTLGAIAARAGTSVSALVRANDIRNPNLIVAGTRLRLSGSGGGSGSSYSDAPRGGAVHTVRAGETLSAIAARYGSTVSAIAKRNRLSNPNMVIAGRKLSVPGGGSSSGRVALRPASRGSIASSLHRQAVAHGVSPSLVKALAYVESGWRQNVVSSAGAIGVMQVLPSTARYINSSLGGHGLNVRVADDNVHLGVMYLRHLIQTMGSEKRALAAYYTGPGNVGRRLNRAQRWYANAVMSHRDRFR